MPAHKIALFGGTFDPVHLGHLRLMEKARDRFAFGRVIVLPCARSPFKGAATTATADQRCQMIELALEELGLAAWAELSRFEADRPPPSYTWQTASHFAEAFPDAELNWIMGADQWETVQDWAKTEILQQLLTFVVVTREGSSVQSKPGWKHRSLEFAHPASATAIREGLGDSSWLPHSVRVYCEKNRLYPFPDNL